MAQALNPPWDLHSNTATKSLVLRDMKATVSPRLGGLFQPKPKRHLQIREISNVSDVSDVSLKGSFYLQLAAAALSGITILDSYIQTQEMMVTTWTYQLGSSTSCVLTEFVTSSRLEHPTNPKETLNHPHGKGKLPFSLDRISGSWTVQSTVVLILDIFVVPFRCSTIFLPICQNSTPIPCLSLRCVLIWSFIALSI